ncbi:hypothetical protein [Paenibacillus donghaensis]|uniref:Uncharacterized protein n=1 Tax=Paenibacillus donghaensis TaxID=414771 RepID=A0A2Z2KBA4_9BACL|nr:hypothetical protein [Paenibacillus donghaensis]ASA20925.1 hypothetical protein B9T62_09090 [Paenibacillus donghaensis]
MTQTPRDWQKDMEMCEAATRGPWKVFKGVSETLIGTAYDHTQMKGPDSIVGHAISAHGDYVYIRENDAKLLAEARTALPYWLQEAKIYKQSYEATLTAYTAEKARAEAAEAREQRLKEAIENALKWTWCSSEANMSEIDTVLNDILSTLYPDTPAPTGEERGTHE